MRCHYVYDKEAGKVPIPGCMGAAAMGVMPEDCTCRGKPETFEQFEKQRYNEVVKDLTQKIKDLEAHIFQQERIIKKLLHSKP